MSSYFDDLRTQVSEIADAPDFIEQLEALEEKVIKEVSLVTGDKYFPNDLRERIFRCIALCGVKTLHLEGMEVKSEARDTALLCKYSVLFEELHSLFHEVGRRNIDAPYKLSDSPSQILKQRGL